MSIGCSHQDVVSSNAIPKQRPQSHDKAFEHAIGKMHLQTSLECKMDADDELWPGFSRGWEPAVAHDWFGAGGNCINRLADIWRICEAPSVTTPKTPPVMAIK
jgi:hypothetical protein